MIVSDENLENIDPEQIDSTYVEYRAGGWKDD